MKAVPEAFDFDPGKSLLNWCKHGQALAFATVLWLDQRKVYLDGDNHHGETRYRIVASHQGKVWTCVFTLRQGTYRLISLRRAWKKEAAAYRHRELRPGLRKRR